MPPYGGEPRRGFDTQAALENTPKMFRGGEADQELVASYASGDMAVLVAIARAHSRDGGTADQGWALRVTLGFRRAGPALRVVGRHPPSLHFAPTLRSTAG